MSITTKPELIRDSADALQAVLAARTMGKTVGVVMTMGALHEGHLSLVKAAVDACDMTVVTIFVNPAQFLPGEDLQTYPRQLARDLEALQGLPVDVVLAPDECEIYRPDHSTFVQPPRIAQRLEGQCRPGHFRGVATIVLKLLHIAPADIAFFGHKDYQQYLVIRDMVADFDLPIEIRVCPTVREPDGLALSSRNKYLSADQRRQAQAISRSLYLAEQLVHDGHRDTNSVVTRMRQELHQAGIARIEYVTIADPETLDERRRVTGPSLAAIAAYVGDTRLIDNLLIRVPR